ncbi:hypothetical protein, partial [Pseudomonas syringae group genomosp. 3]|uniref:hypothetical protein n=1 Tax=Pseudomonas syringae group genomosp. 3 TaxID=251701 RepID=UPI001C810261
DNAAQTPCAARRDHQAGANRGNGLYAFSAQRTAPDSGTIHSVQSTEAVDNSVDNPPLTSANASRMGPALKLTIFSPAKKNDVFH